MVAPVTLGQKITVTPEGTGKHGDLFVSIDGFFIFIKEVPESMREAQMVIRIICVKQNCGIAVYDNPKT